MVDQSLIPLLRRAGVECYTRKEWGSPREADGSYARRRRTHPMPDGPAECHFLHITVTGDTDLPAEGKAAARVVETYGYSSPPMVSYQDLITNEGRYFEGQSYGVKGTHTQNDKNVRGFPEDLNRYGYALALMQNVGDEVTDVQVDVAAKVFAARELLGLVKRGAPIYPHRKFAYKACPGDKAVARLDEIERLKNHYVRTGLEEDDMAQHGEEILKIVKRLDRLEKARATLNGKRARRQVEFMDDVVALLEAAEDQRAEIKARIEQHVAAAKADEQAAAELEAAADADEG